MGGAKPAHASVKNHKQDDGAGYSKRVKRGGSQEAGIQNPRVVRVLAGRNTVHPGGPAGKRDVTTTVNFGDKPAGCLTIAATREAAERFRGDYPEASRFLKHRAYADDAIPQGEREARWGQKSDSY